jgi:glycosyltransferase involved in cell wall biosynthesis
VTCLCLTKDRRQWLPKAIQCYQAQTYPNRELLILADGEDVRDLVPVDDSSVRLIHIDQSLEIGEKRNFGCARAAGEVIAHWDDDDYSAPGRISDQIARMQQTGKAVTGYNRMRFTDGTVWWQYSGIPLYGIGTSLCYRKDWWAAHNFRRKQIGEDNDFCDAARNAAQLSAADAGELMYATIHPGNTSPRNKADNWKLIA